MRRYNARDSIASEKKLRKEVTLAQSRAENAECSLEDLENELRSAAGQLFEAKRQATELDARLTSSGRLYRDRLASKISKIMFGESLWVALILAIDVIEPL